MRQHIKQAKALTWLFSATVSLGSPLAFSQATTGAQSPAFGTVQGDVTINYHEAAPAHVPGYVLRNRTGGAMLIVAEPTLEAATTPHLRVCVAPAGTRISLDPETTAMDNPPFWRKVNILSGECAQKTGWTAMENIQVEYASSFVQ